MINPGIWDIYTDMPLNKIWFFFVYFDHRFSKIKKHNFLISEIQFYDMRKSKWSEIIFI